MLSLTPSLELVAELRREHQGMREALERARWLGASSAEARAVLLGIEEPLAAHLAKENTVVYPTLARAAGEDPALAITLQVFATDGQAVLAAVAALFARLRSGDGGLAMVRELGRFRGLLLERMQREENVLYAEYARVAAARA